MLKTIREISINTGENLNVILECMLNERKETFRQLKKEIVMLELLKTKM